jgi:hypothetical protein
VQSLNSCLAVVGARLEKISEWTWKKVPTCLTLQTWAKNFRPGPHIVPMWDKSVFGVKVKVRVNTQKQKISTY